MKLHDDGDFVLCDYFGCSNRAIAESQILDDDGEDQGVEMLCLKHHPGYRHTAFRTDAIPELESFIATLPSQLVEVTDPTSFESVQKLVDQTESLNKIQNNIRNHNGI